MKIKALFFVLLAFLAGCRVYPDYASDFRFPIVSGDIEAGELAFVNLGCHQCHEVDGVQLPILESDRLLTVALGGELIFAKTYGDLVTSIINPDHVISDRYLSQLPREQRTPTAPSPMPLNEEMKVTELIDIVAFLNSKYRLLPGYTEYYY